MAVAINLLKTAKRKQSAKVAPVKNKRLINSTVVLFILMIIAASGVYAYRLVLAKEVEVLDGDIAQQESIIASYKEVEERKSLLTLKTNEIEKIYDSKFDYLKAIKDAQQLFGFSIAIESIELEKSGVVDVTARKVSDITLSTEQAFSTNIQELNLTIIVPTSFELEDTIDTLLGFQGQGLSSVVVTSTELTEEGEYQVEFAITFSSGALETVSPAPTE